MRAPGARAPWTLPVVLAAVVFGLAGCAQGGSPSSPSQSKPAGSGNPACDLITPAIAAKVDPGLVQMGQNGKPAGSPAYLCSYMSKYQQVLTLSVALISPASAAEIAETKKAPDCSVVDGIGDFACLQWTGWFRGEPAGASANTVLKAVKGNESLTLNIVALPPIAAGTPVPDGNASAHALAQAAIDGGWGNGSALRVPAAPPAGQQTTSNNPVCALVSPDAVKNAFGATTQAQILPGEGSCRYLFGTPSTPGPDSLMFSIELHEGGASLLSGVAPPDGQIIQGVGDSAILVVRSEPGGPKALRPESNAPVTYMSLMVARGPNMAFFTAQILISPDGPNEAQTQEQFITLVKGIDF